MSHLFNRTSKFLQLLFIFFIYSNYAVAVESSSTSNIIICEDGKNTSAECNGSTTTQSAPISKIIDDTSNDKQQITLSYNGSNTWDGSGAFSSGSGAANSAFGYIALYASSGDYNTAIGTASLRYNSGSYNSALGLETLFSSNSGSYKSSLLQFNR